MERTKDMLINNCHIAKRTSTSFIALLTRKILLGDTEVCKEEREDVKATGIDLSALHAFVMTPIYLDD